MKTLEQKPKSSLTVAHPLLKDQKKYTRLTVKDDASSLMQCGSSAPLCNEANRKG